MPDMTTTEAAALLSERGIIGRNGQPVKADTVKHWCIKGLFPGATSIGGRVWQIPREAVEQFEQPTIGRPKQPQTRQGSE